MTTYRNIEGHPGYRVGDDGSVWSCKTKGRHAGLGGDWHRLRLTRNSTGYLTVSLRAGRRAPNLRYVHRLVLGAFAGPCPAGMEGCHFDGNRQNNAAQNLRWDSPAGNNADKERHGTKLVGSRCPRAKLGETDIPAIFARKASGESASGIARDLGVQPDAVVKILAGKRWKHVPR
jgi:hypothetical protein